METRDQILMALVTGIAFALHEVIYLDSEKQPHPERDPVPILTPRSVTTVASGDSLVQNGKVYLTYTRLPS